MFATVIAQLITWALKIKNQTVIAGNTETLVGGLFEQIVMLIKSLADTVANLVVGWIWQNPVNNVSDLATTYPNPKLGYAAFVKNANVIYVWNGTAWVNSGIIGFPSNVITTDNLSQIIDTSTIKAPSNKAVYDALLQKANISQIIDSSVSNSPSSYIVGLALADKTDKKNFYNVSQGTNNFEFATKVAARTAVSATYRALGQTIGYKLATGELIFEAFKGTILTGTGWTADTNWVSVGGIDSNLLPANTETTITTIITPAMLSSGTINSGIENANDTRLRTPFLSVIKKPFTVNIGANFQFRVSYFDENGIFMLPDETAWSNSGLTVANTRGASFVRLVMRNLTDTNLTIFDELNLSVVRSQNIVLSPRLDVDMSDISSIKKVLPSGYLPNIYKPILLQGSLGTAGEVVTDPNRVHSEKVYVNKLPFDISLGDGFQFLTRYFNTTGAVIYSDPAWITGGGTFNQASAVYIQTIIRRNPDAVTVPADITSFHVNTRTNGKTLVRVSRENEYNVLDYGVSTFNYDNSTAVQALVDLVAAKGGGTILFPVGTYNFRAISGSGNSRAAIVPKSNVSFVGESITGTVLKMTAPGYYALFNRQDETKVNPLVGCKFSNFTVDAYDVHPTTTYTTVGKAFYFQNVVNGIFRDLIIKGTPSTSVGIDFLVNVLIHNVTVIEGGRLSDERRLGGSGIGIGTDFFDEENFIISDCVTIGCGNYGIFIESQAVFGDATAHSRGMIIANCISRDNKNTGIGIRTGRKVIINGCTVYNNKNNGVELKWKIDGVKLSNCIISDNVGAGVLIDTTTYNGYTADIKKLDLDNNLIYNNTTNGIEISGETRPFADVTIKGNTIYENTISGVNVKIPTTGLGLKDNITKRNPKGLIISSNSQIDTIIENNIFTDGVTILGSQFMGDISFNQLLPVKMFKKLTAASTAISITESTIAALSHTITETANYTGNLLLNILRAGGSSSRDLTVKIKVNGILPDNGQRQLQIAGDGLIHSVDSLFESETPLNVGDVITVTIQASATGLSLVSGTGYTAARLIIEKV